MPKIIEITASFGQTIQLKQYEPINLHASVKAEVSEKESLEEAFQECFAIVRDEVNNRITTVKKKIQAQKNSEMDFI